MNSSYRKCGKQMKEGDGKGTLHMNHTKSNILWERISKYSNTMIKMMQPSFSVTSSKKYSKNSINLPISNSRKLIIINKMIK